MTINTAIRFASRAEIRTHLIKLGTGRVDPLDLSSGICLELSDFICPGIDLGYQIVSLLCKDWPDYSGHSSYPVPAPPGCPISNVLPPEQVAYTQAHADGADLWDRETAYGRKRREFCVYLSEHLWEDGVEELLEYTKRRLKIHVEAS